MSDDPQDEALVPVGKTLGERLAGTWSLVELMPVATVMAAFERDACLTPMRNGGCRLSDRDFCQVMASHPQLIRPSKAQLALFRQEVDQVMPYARQGLEMTKEEWRRRLQDETLKPVDLRRLEALGKARGFFSDKPTEDINADASGEFAKRVRAAMNRAAEEYRKLRPPLTITIAPATTKPPPQGE